MGDDVSGKEMDRLNELAEQDTQNALRAARVKDHFEIAGRFNATFSKTHRHTTTDGGTVLVKVTKSAWVEGGQAYFIGADLDGDGEPAKFELHLTDYNGISVKRAE